MTPDNNAEIEAIKKQIFTLFVALIVVSGTVTVYLYRQVSLARKDIAQYQQTAKTLSQNEDAIGNFVGRLVQYSQRHPDFRPILLKYGIAPPPPGTPVGAAPKK